VQFLEIDECHEGQRIDNYLLRILKGVPKSRVYRIVRKGEVRVNKSRVKPEYKLAVGDVVRVPPVKVAERGAPVTVSVGLDKHLQAAILFEDDRLLIVNKPSGLAVHGGSGVSLGLIEALRSMRPDAKFLELVHRLDKDTSGCVMVAKKRSALKALHELLRSNKGIDKRYWALVHGKWPSRKVVVSEPLEKFSLKSGERMVRVSPDGKRCKTEYAVLNRYTGASLIEARPITGRTHQIRVHCQHAGYPIVGDTKYGDEKADKAFVGQGVDRLFLHARSLRFVLDGQLIQVEAELESKLSVFLDRNGS
jgi:23S rRNA pseudouridine955/2504/2580 synthase